MTTIPIKTITDIEWQAQHKAPPIKAGQEPLYVELIQTLAAEKPLTGKRYNQIIQQYTRRGLPWLSKSQLLHAYQPSANKGS